MDAAVVAVAAGDYATAISKALAAQGLLSSLPKLSRSAGGGGQQEVEWDSAGIDNFIKRLRQQQGASLGVQSQDIQFNDPTLGSSGDGFMQPEGITQ